MFFVYFLPTSSPPLGERDLGGCSLGAQSSGALTHWHSISTEPTCSPHSYWLEVSGRPPRRHVVPGEGNSGFGRSAGACRVLRIAVPDTAVQPWQNRSPRLAASPTRLPSVAARTRTPAPRWAQNLFFPSRGPGAAQLGPKREQIPRLCRPGWGWIRASLDRRCRSARLRRARVGWEEG